VSLIALFLVHPSHTWTSKYLSDPTEDVRVAAENILADFLREIRQITQVRKRSEEQAKLKREVEGTERDPRPKTEEKETLDDSAQTAFLSDLNSQLPQHDAQSTLRDDRSSEIDLRDVGGVFSRLDCLD
jgi:vacuole morphology and inheritance protein 14